MNLQAPLVLASQSPRRQQLLRDAGFSFEVVVRPVTEEVLSELSPQEVAINISEAKAQAYNDLAHDHIVITADTIVCLDAQILGKPANKAAAFEMLKSLAGRKHSVITGVSIAYQDRVISFAEETLVYFKALSDQALEYYIDTYQPYDKAGAYGIQEWIGMVGISHIQGDYYNVMGLPTSRLYTALKIFMK